MESRSTTGRRDRGPSPTTARLIGLALDIVVVVAGAGGVAAAVGGLPGGALILLLAPLACALQLLRGRVAAEADWAPLGDTATGPRAVTVVAVATGFTLTAAGAAESAAAALASFIALCCLAIEPLVARASRFRPPLAAHLPGVSEPGVDRDPGPSAVIAGLLASAVGAVLLMTETSAWWWVAVEVLAAVPLGLVVLLAARRILAGRRRRAAVPAALARYRPDFLLYTGRPDDASYQLTMWLEYFRRAGLRFAIVTRFPAAARALADLVAEPVVEARSDADLLAVVPDSARAVFYVNASARNSTLVADRRLRHVYVGHGDSDKPPSFNPTHALYDEIFTAGPAAARRYPAHGVEIAAEKFRVVGRPQVERVGPARGPIADQQPPVVLYAPTWRGHVEESALSSLPVGERIVSSLLARGDTVIFRPHPFSHADPADQAVISRIGALLGADAARSGRGHLWGPAAETELGILDCLNASDAMVADVSSVVSDYLFSGKPFAMVSVPSSPQAFLEEYPVARAAYVVRGDLGDLESQLDAMLGPDPLAERRREVRTDYLGDFPAEGYSSAFVDAVLAVCAAGPVLAESTLEPADTAGADAAGGDTGVGAVGAVTTPVSRPPTVLGGARGTGGAILQLAGAAMAAAALVVAMLAGPGWLVAVAVLLAVLELLVSSSASLRTPGQWPRLLGSAGAARVALAAAGPMVAARAGAGTLGWLLAAALVAACLLSEDRIRAGWEGGLVTRRLPGVLERIRPLVPRGLVPMLGLVLSAGMAVVVAVPLDGWLRVAGWLSLAGALLLAALTSVALERALRRADDVDHEAQTLRSALRTYQPELVLYSSATTGAGQTIAPWLPVLARLDRPWLIVVRAMPALDEIDRACRAAGVDVPLVLRPTQRGVEDIVVPSLRLALYVDDAARNAHLIERRDLTHVRLNLVGAARHPVHAVYDVVLGPAALTAQRYAEAGLSLPPEKLWAVSDPTGPDAAAADVESFLDVLRRLLEVSESAAESR